MLSEKHVELIESYNLPIKINPNNWVVCWEDRDVLEIVNSRHRRMRFEKKGINK